MFSRIYSKLVFPNKRPRNDAVVSRTRVCVYVRVCIMNFVFCDPLRSLIYPFSTRDRVAVRDPACAGPALFVSSSSSPISSSVFRRTATHPIERVTSRFARNTVFQSLSGYFNLSRLLFYALRILPNILRTGSTIFTFRVFSRALFFSFVFFPPPPPSLSPLRLICGTRTKKRESNVSRLT